MLLKNRSLRRGGDESIVRAHLKFFFNLLIFNHAWTETKNHRSTHQNKHTTIKTINIMDTSIFGGKPFTGKKNHPPIAALLIFYYMMKKLYMDKITPIRRKTQLLSQYAGTYQTWNFLSHRYVRVLYFIGSQGDWVFHYL